MCTAIVSVGPVVLLAGVRDEFVARSWEPPARHWPEHPGLIGGRDLTAGGTWLAVFPEARRTACVLNGRGTPAPAASRRSRGVLPLQAAAEGKLAQPRMADFDPFHLLVTEPGRATMTSWDGENTSERELGPGLHMIVNSGLSSELLADSSPTDQSAPGRERELARLAWFLPRLRAATRPAPKPGEPVERAWGDWLPLINGAGLPPQDPRALIVRHEFGDGRIWGTTSISLVALSPGELRYDFTASPGDPSAWRPVPLSEPG
jgi:hypothetical protein